MKKTVLGVLVFLCATVGFAADRPTAPEITAPVNGDEWLKLSSSEKLFWSIGFSQGYQEALEKIDVTSGAGTPCASLAARTERQSSTAGKVSGFELDPRLGADSHLLADGPLSQLRLMDDTRYPWLLLVPRLFGAIELISVHF